MLKTAARSVRRSPLRTLCTVLACAVMAAFLLVYCRNLDHTVKTMRATAESIEVTAQIDALTGLDDPYLPEPLLAQMRDTGFLTNETLKTHVPFGFGKYVAKRTGNRMVALSSAGIDRYLTNRLGAMLWGEGWTLDTWLASDRPAVLLPQSAGYQPGGTAELTLLSDDREKAPRLCVSMLVAGVYNDDLDDEDRLMKARNERFAFCPLPWLRSQYGQGDWVDRQLQYRYADFALQNKENINTFKTKMTQMGFNTAQTGLRLTLNDHLLIGAINPLKRTVTLMRVLLPVLFAMVGLLGALLSYLTMHGRRRELAVMRSMGQTRGKAFLAFFFEMLLLCMAGGLLGYLALLSGDRGGLRPLWPLPLLWVCYLAGGAIAIRLLDRPNVLALLRDDV